MNARAFVEYRETARLRAIIHRHRGYLIGMALALPAVFLLRSRWLWIECALVLMLTLLSKISVWRQRCAMRRDLRDEYERHTK